MSFKASTQKRKQIWVFALGFLVALFSFSLWWAVGTELPKESELIVHHHADFTHASPKKQIRIATYNIAFGQGVKREPTEWRDEPYTRKKLSEVAQTIKRMDAEIILLQEVDLQSNRSHHIDQAKLIVHESQYPYSACAVVWDKNYVPFPFWPPEFHIGEVKTANCVLSKYPMKEHKRIIFDKPESNPFWYNWGYLDRGAQRLEVIIGDKILNIANMHLEAFEQEAREKQAHLLIQWLSDIKGPLVLGGDFNAIPRHASKKHGFVDEPDVSFATDRTLQNIEEGLGHYQEAIAHSVCSANESACMTYPANAATRRLDYMFATRGARFVEGRVVHEAGEASDHLPVMGIVEFD
jgi:endonuclease/exonuclease/phosphatase family metal-dependent hydrolase